MENLIKLDSKRIKQNKKKYFSILSFNQIINEAQTHLDKIQFENFNSEVLNDSRLIVSELKKRLDQFSLDYTKSIENLEKNFKDL